MIYGITLLEILFIATVLTFGTLSVAYENTLVVIAAFILALVGVWWIYDVDFTSIPLWQYAVGVVAYFVIGGLYTMMVSWPR